MQNVRFPGLRVLVVDDDSMMTALLSMILSDYDVDLVGVANNGNAALELLSGKAADVLICDLNMPGMDGVQLMGLVSTLEQRPAIIVLSGEDSRILDSSRQFAEAKNLTVLGVLNKPIAHESLVALLARYQRKEQRAANKAPDVALDQAHIRAGLEGTALRLSYQPKVDLRTGRLVGVEGLLRWTDPESGVLCPPGEVIMAAERHHLINELTLAIFAQAVRDRRIAAAGGLAVNFAINLSLENLKEASIADQMLMIAAREAATPSDFTLEITETHLIDDLARILEPLLRLRLQGFKIALDDFGTGASTMQMLSQLPSTELKIDRSFVAAGPLGSQGRAFLQSAVELGRQMGQSIVAEGIETNKELELAIELGCHLGQGYLFSRPLPLEDLMVWERSRAGMRATAGMPVD
ncbi:MAG TPA: EAL domain-containing response regulator [Pseudoxanthomonas sp.]|nr:EAL domain-containing response regulator [Pseudoxanthomonas sp.]